MSTRKKVETKPVTAKVAVIDDDDEPNKYQTIKGIQYERPKHFACTPAGIMAWVYDVDNYPDKK